MPTNEYGQRVGDDLGEWTAPMAPEPVVLAGRHVRLEPLDPSRHSPAMFPAFGGAPASSFTYMAFEPPRSGGELRAVLEGLVATPGLVPYAVLVDGTPAGFCTYLRVDAPNGVIEIGSITFSPLLQRTTAATEAIRLLIGHAFALGYRRVEWKCDDLNEPSRSAAVRFGFRYEGTFRNATHYKGRSRDTAWFAIIDADWPRIRQAFDVWLAPDNFDEQGGQRRRLEDLRRDLNESGS